MPNYFPIGYQPAYYPQYQQQYQNNQMQQPQQMQNQNQQQTPPIQQSGFVRVQSENDARMYPVAPGNSVTFIDDNAPYCYVKTMDISQLDRPKFEKYRLVKEEDAPVVAANAPKSADNTSEGKVINYATKSDLEVLWGEIEALKEKLTEAPKEATKKPTPKAKKEVTEDE